MYDAYAPIYDAIGQGQFSAKMAERALAWLADRGERPTRVLDMACGTGAAALVFAAAGCRAVGVDRSSAMLGIARGRARGAGADVTFVEGDIRLLEPRRGIRRVNQEPESDLHSSRFSVLGSWYDLVTCFYDSLNYLTGDGDLGRVFTGVARALAPGGRLLFDINTAAEFATWDDRDVVTYDGSGILVYNRLSYDPAARLATGRIAWFVREIDRWWRGEETHVERAWSDADVQNALEQAGLSLEARLDPHWQPATQDATRVVYVARR
jgi:SAM-dependent methyltransferase